MNWNPVVSALTEEFLGAVEQKKRVDWQDKERNKERVRNLAIGRQDAVWRVAKTLGLTEHLRKEVDYLLDEEEKSASV